MQLCALPLCTHTHRYIFWICWPSKYWHFTVNFLKPRAFSYVTTVYASISGHQHNSKILSCNLVIESVTRPVRGLAALSVCRPPPPAASGPEVEESARPGQQRGPRWWNVHSTPFPVSSGLTLSCDVFGVLCTRDVGLSPGMCVAPSLVLWDVAQSTKVSNFNQVPFTCFFLRCALGATSKAPRPPHPARAESSCGTAAAVAEQGALGLWVSSSPEEKGLFCESQELEEQGLPEIVGRRLQGRPPSPPPSPTTDPIIQALLLFRCSVGMSCLTLCDPMDCSTPGLPVHHQLLELTQTHVHQAGEAIQPSHPLSSPSPPALNLSQHQGLFKWVSSLYQVAKGLELQLQHQSFQWILRTNFL